MMPLAFTVALQVADPPGVTTHASAAVSPDDRRRRGRALPLRPSYLRGLIRAGGGRTAIMERPVILLA